MGNSPGQSRFEDLLRETGGYCYLSYKHFIEQFSQTHSEKQKVRKRCSLLGLPPAPADTIMGKGALLPANL